MGKGSNLLKGRVNVRKLKDGSGAGVRVDGVDVGTLVGSKEQGYYWSERPDLFSFSRLEATDKMIRFMIDQGRIDPERPLLNLREEAEITADVMHRVMTRDKGLCQYCLIQGEQAPWTAYDHFIPASAGGDGSFENVQLACNECNRRKWHHHPRDLWGDDWREWGPLRDRTSSRVRVWSK